jgi:hypothetical protein
MINIAKATLYAAVSEHHNPFHQTSLYGGPLNLYCVHDPPYSGTSFAASLQLAARSGFQILKVVKNTWHFPQAA